MKGNHAVIDASKLGEPVRATLFSYLKAQISWKLPKNLLESPSQYQLTASPSSPQPRPKKLRLSTSSHNLPLAVCPDTSLPSSGLVE